MRRHRSFPRPRRLLGAAATVVLLSCATAATSAAASNTTTSTQDRSFMVAAHQSNLAEIAAGNTAEQKGATRGVRAMGARLVTDHSRLDASLRRLATTLHVSLPNAPTPLQQRELNRISQLSGTSFDTAWTNSQITGHLTSLTVIRQEIDHGDNPQVKAAARTAQPVVETHLRMLRALPSADANSGRTGSDAAGFEAGPVVLGLARQAA